MLALLPWKCTNVESKFIMATIRILCSFTRAMDILVFNFQFKLAQTRMDSEIKSLDETLIALNKLSLTDTLFPIAINELINEYVHRPYINLIASEKAAIAALRKRVDDDGI